jgi:translation initiation factor IF-3
VVLSARLNQPQCWNSTICEEKRISANEFRVNETIRVPEVRLIDGAGENIGVVNTREALRMAHEAELDLVEVAPNSSPPVCRIMDFGKFLYEREKKDREARRAQTKVEIKEIKLRPKTTEHHRDFKVEDARRWLDHGMKVRVTIRFRGREITYPEIALEDLKEIAQELSDVSIVEQAPTIEGRAMSMMLSSAKGTKKKVKESAETKPDQVENIEQQPQAQEPAESRVKE